MPVAILTLFVLGYGAIIFEHNLRVNKAAAALLAAVSCWTLYFVGSTEPLRENLTVLLHHLADVSQILFFLLGGMALVELMDAHGSFHLVTRIVKTDSQRGVIWVTSILAFFLSAILDNLTTTILMVSLLRRLVPVPHERFWPVCLIVVAANAGGAWTPIGDVTTTMLWIGGQISTWPIMKALLLPSLVSLTVPLVWAHFCCKGGITRQNGISGGGGQEPGARLLLAIGMLSLISVPIFKQLTGLPPFMGMLMALGVVWVVTDLMHYEKEDRAHLRVPQVLGRIDISSILFFLGILLAVDALDAVGLLKKFSATLSSYFSSYSLIATILGIVSSVIDNVPLVAATMGMYPLSTFPMDHSLWQMIAYAAGTGGSLLIIGSAAGVAMMGMERITFFAYARKMTLPILLGYLLGMGCYLIV